MVLEGCLELKLLEQLPKELPRKQVLLEQAEEWIEEFTLSLLVLLELGPMLRKLLLQLFHQCQ